MLHYLIFLEIEIFFGEEIKVSIALLFEIKLLFDNFEVVKKFKSSENISKIQRFEFNSKFIINTYKKYRLSVCNVTLALQLGVLRRMFGE